MTGNLPRTMPTITPGKLPVLNTNVNDAQAEYQKSVAKRNEYMARMKALATNGYREPSTELRSAADAQQPTNAAIPAFGGDRSPTPPVQTGSQNQQPIAQPTSVFSNNRSHIPLAPTDPQVQNQQPALTNPQSKAVAQSQQQSEAIAQTQKPAYFMSTPDAPIEHDRNAFGRFLQPRQDELDAADNGSRWRNALQNDALIPGTAYANQVMQAAQIEGRGQSTPAQNDRAREMQRRALMSQYDKLIFDFTHNNWNDNPDGQAAAYAEGQKLLEQYAASGFDPADLRAMPRQSAGSSVIQNKQLTDVSETIMDTEYLGRQMQKSLATNQPIDKNVLDKVTQRLAASLGGDAKSMGEGEKIRIQTQFLSQEEKQKVYDTTQWYRNTLNHIMAAGADKAWSANWKDKLAEIEDDYDKGRPDLALAGLVPLLKSNEKQLSYDLQSDLGAATAQYDHYMQAMLLAAQIDQVALYNTAKYLHDQQQNKYNEWAQQRGIAKRYDEPMPDIDLDALRAMNSKNSPFLERPGFTSPQGARTPQGPAVDFDPNSKTHGNRYYGLKPPKIEWRNR